MKNLSRFSALLLAAGLARADLPPAFLHSVTGALGVLDQIHAQPDPAALEQALAEAVLQAADPGARILEAAEWEHFQEERDGQDFTLGVRLSMSNGLPAVIGVISNSPAAQAGIQVGDLLTAVNGEELANIGISRAALLVRSHTNESLRLGLRRAGAEPREVTAVLALGQVPGVESADLLGGDLASLRLNGLYAGTAVEVLTHLTNWQARGRFGVVLDLRGADGRDEAAVAALAGRFEQGGHLLHTFRSFQDQDLTVLKAPAGEPFEMPLVVLVDGETTGAAELLAATLSGSVRGALVVGFPTSGDPLLRQAVPLSGGRVALIAARKLVTADGKTYDGRHGVAPDVALTNRGDEGPEYEPNLLLDRRQQVTEELEDRALRSRLVGDAGLRRAVDILLGLKALNIRAFRASAADHD